MHLLSIESFRVLERELLCFLIESYIRKLMRLISIPYEARVKRLSLVWFWLAGKSLAIRFQGKQKHYFSFDKNNKVLKHARLAG